MAKGRGARWPFFFLGLLVGVAGLVTLIVLAPGWGVPLDGYLFGRPGNARLEARIADLEARLAEAREAAAVPLDTRPAVDEEVNGLRAKLNLAENVTTELQAQVDKARNEEIPALEAAIAERDATLKRFDDEIARLSAAETELQRLKETQASADAAKSQDSAEVKRLQGQLAQRDALLKQFDAELTRLSSVEDELKALRATRAEKQAEKQIGEDTEGSAGAQPGEHEIPDSDTEAVTRDDGQASTPSDGDQQAADRRAAEKQAALESQVAELKEDVARRDTMLRQLDAEVARLSPLEEENRLLRTQLDEAKAGGAETGLRTELDEAKQRIQGLRSEVAERDGELQRLRDELARLTLSGEEPDEAPPAERSLNEPSPAESPSTDRQPTPRDPLRVAGAMREARGLDDIPDTERDRVATGLIEGECVRDVLTDVFGTPPANALKDLVDKLESDC